MNRLPAHAPFLVSVVTEARRPVHGPHREIAASDTEAPVHLDPRPGMANEDRTPVPAPPHPQASVESTRPRQKHPERDVDPPLSPTITAEAVTSRQPETTGSVPGTPANPVSLPERTPAETFIPKIARSRAAQDRSDVVPEADDVVAAREQLPVGDSPSPGARQGASSLQLDVSVSSPRPATEHFAATESFADTAASLRSRRSTATGGEGWPASAAPDVDRPPSGEPATHARSATNGESRPLTDRPWDAGVDGSGERRTVPAFAPSSAGAPSAGAGTSAPEGTPFDAVRQGEVEGDGSPDRESPEVRIGHVEIFVAAAPRRTPEHESDVSLTSRKYLRRL